MEFADHIRRPERWAKVLGWATLAGIECGVIGPFGSYPANLFTRIFYWTGLFWAGSLLLWPSIIAALALGPRRGFPPLFSGVVVALIACAPLAALAAGGCYLFWPVHASGIRVLEWYGLTLCVALPAVGWILWLEVLRWTRRETQAGIEPPAETAIADGENREARAPVAVIEPHPLLSLALCLQMEDHHVRVHMDGHSALHLATMRDLVERMAGRSGLQVHRSWWVARDAVRGWREDGRSIVLILANGLDVPVARNRVAILRAEGWLGDADAPRTGAAAVAA